MVLILIITTYSALISIIVFGVKDNLLCAIERGETLIEIVFFLTGATLGGSPKLNRIDGDFQVDNAHGQGGGHRNTQEKDHPRPSSADYPTKQTLSNWPTDRGTLFKKFGKNINNLQVPQAVKKTSSAFSMDAPARSIKDPWT